MIKLIDCVLFVVLFISFLSVCFEIFGNVLVGEDGLW